jgi:hypothetical protein
MPRRSGTRPERSGVWSNLSEVYQREGERRRRRTRRTSNLSRRPCLSIIIIKNKCTCHHHLKDLIIFQSSLLFTHFN